MRISRSFIRNAATWLFLSVLFGILTAVAAEWFIEVARDKGLFEDAGARWDRAMTAISNFVTSGWLLYPMAILGGCVLGLWIDVLLRRSEIQPSSTQGPASTVPQRFIDLIDRDDQEINQRIGLHAISKPIQVKRQLEAPEPYLDITVHIRNTSVFELELQSIQGRFKYKGHSLQNDPECLNLGIVITRYRARAINIRQYVTQSVAAQLLDWKECEFNIREVVLNFSYNNMYDIGKSAHFKLRGPCHLVDLS